MNVGSYTYRHTRGLASVQIFDDELENASVDIFQDSVMLLVWGRLKLIQVLLEDRRRSDEQVSVNRESCLLRTNEDIGELVPQFTDLKY